MQQFVIQQQDRDIDHARRERVEEPGCIEERSCLEQPRRGEDADGRGGEGRDGVREIDAADGG